MKHQNQEPFGLTGIIFDYHYPLEICENYHKDISPHLHEGLAPHGYIFSLPRLNTRQKKAVQLFFFGACVCICCLNNGEEGRAFFHPLLSTVWASPHDRSAQLLPLSLFFSFSVSLTWWWFTVGLYVCPFEAILDSYLNFNFDGIDVLAGTRGLIPIYLPI